MSAGTPKYRIGAVARLTGLSTHALRVWERRYAAVEPARTEGGDRVYSDADVERLRRLKLLVDAGHAISQIADLADDELRDMAAFRSRGPLAEAEALLEVRERFLAAIEVLDLATAEDVIARAALLLEPRELIMTVLSPIFTEIGARWESGRIRVAHEHAASSVLRSLLGVLARNRADDAADLAVATTLSGELHEFGALLASLLAGVSGWRSIYLGPNLPPEEIVAAVTQADASLVMLSLVNDANELARDELRTLTGALPASVRLLLGGRSATRYRADAPSAVIFDDLRGAEQYLLRASSEPDPAPRA